jgi:hypothetical protein
MTDVGSIAAGGRSARILPQRQRNRSTMYLRRSAKDILASVRKCVTARYLRNDRLNLNKVG